MSLCLHCKIETKNPKFCSRKCSCSYNNTKFPKRKLIPAFCKKCDKDLNRTSFKDGRTLCDKCNPFIKNWNNIRIKDMHSSRKYQISSRIRNLARNSYKKSGRPRKCISCGYNKTFQICHIKPIKSFNSNTLISIVNHPDNLIALCPNCHWELDHGLLLF